MRSEVDWKRAASTCSNGRLHPTSSPWARVQPPYKHLRYNNIVAGLLDIEKMAIQLQHQSVNRWGQMCCGAVDFSGLVELVAFVDEQPVQAAHDIVHVDVDRDNDPSRLYFRNHIDEDVTSTSGLCQIEISDGVECCHQGAGSVPSSNLPSTLALLPEASSNESWTRSRFS